MTSNLLMAEIRLTWWREVLDQIYSGQPVRLHPTAQAVAAAVQRRRLPREPLEGALDGRLFALEGDRELGEIEAAEALTEAAALALDPAVDREAARMLGRSWRSGLLSEAAREAARRVSPAAFPAVAHAALAGRSGGQLAQRLRLTWAVARGRI
jgi:phytoene synthase